MKKKLISIFLVFVILLNFAVGVLLYPKQAQAILPVADTTGTAATFVDVSSNVAQTVAAGAIAVKEWAGKYLKEALRYAGYIAMTAVLDAITKSMISWINNGFEGSPSFVEDWRGILDDAADKAGGQFLTDLAGINLCNFSPNFNIQALLAVPKFETKVKCKLSDIQSNFANLDNELENGDWTNWLDLTQTPQNNPMSVLLTSLNQKIFEEQRERERVEREAIAGRGFLGGKDPATGKITTPSSVTENQINKALTQQYETMSRQVAALSANMGLVGPYVVAIGSALVNKLIGSGFKALVDAAHSDEDISGSSSGGQITSSSAGYSDVVDASSGITDQINAITDAAVAKTTLGSYIADIDNLLTYSTNYLVQANNSQLDLLNCQNSKLTTAQTALSACQLDSQTSGISCANEQTAYDSAFSNKNTTESTYNATTELISDYQNDKLVAQSILDELNADSSYVLSDTIQVSASNFSGDDLLFFLTEAAFVQDVEDVRSPKAKDDLIVYSEEYYSQATTDVTTCQTNLNSCSAAVFSNPVSSNYYSDLNYCAVSP